MSQLYIHAYILFLIFLLIIYYNSIHCSFLCHTVGLCCFSSFIHDGKKLGCPSVGEWRSKLWYIQILGNCSALKVNERSSLQKTWRNLRCMFLSGSSQSEEAENYLSQLHAILGKAKPRWQWAMNVSEQRHRLLSFTNVPLWNKTLTQGSVWKRDTYSNSVLPYEHARL